MLTTPLIIAPKVTVLNFGQITDPTNSNFYKITKQGGTSTITFFPVGYTISRSIPSYKTMTITDDDNNNNNAEKDEDLPLMMAAVGGSTRGRPSGSGGASAAETTATATIEDLAGSPIFRITVADDPENPVVASSPALAWQTLFSRIPGKISSVNGLAKYGLQEPLVVAGIRQLPGAKQAWELALPTVPFPSSTTSASAATAPATTKPAAKKQTAAAASTTEDGGATKKERKPRAKKGAALDENAAAATTGEAGSNTQEGTTTAGKKEPRRRTRSARDKEQKEGEAEVGNNDDDDDDSNMPLVPLLRSAAPTAPKPKRESKPRKPSSTKVTKAQATGFQTSLDAWFEQKKNTSSGDGNSSSNNNAPDDLVELFRQTPQLAASIVEGGGDSNLDSILQGLGSNQGHNHHNKNNTNNKKQNLQLDPHEQNLLDRPLLDRHRAGKSREVFFNAWEKSFFNKQQQLKRNKNAIHNDDKQQQEGLSEVHEDEAPALQGLCVSNVLFRTPDHSDNNTNNNKPPVDVNKSNEDAAEENENNNDTKQQHESKQVLELKKKLEKLASTVSAPIQHQSKEAIISQQRSRFLRTMWDYTSERRKIRMLLETVANNPKMSADEIAKYLNPMVATGSASGMMKAARTVVASQQKNETNTTSSSVDNNNNNMMMMMPSSTSSPKRAAITIVEE